MAFWLQPPLHYPVEAIFPHGRFPRENIIFMYEKISAGTRDAFVKTCTLSSDNLNAYTQHHNITLFYFYKKKTGSHFFCLKNVQYKCTTNGNYICMYNKKYNITFNK